MYIQDVQSEGEGDARAALQSISMTDVLDQDPRPAFILDLFAHGDRADQFLSPIFFNRAFKTQPELDEIVRGRLAPDAYGQASSNTYAAFMKWALDIHVGGVPRAFSYHNMSWTSATINHRWNMVNAIKERQQGTSTGAFRNAAWGPKAVSFVEHKLDEMSEDGSTDSSQEADRQSSTAMFLQKALGMLVPKQTSYDWTTSTPPTNASDHILLCRSVDWAKTPLGPMKSWSSCLRHTANLLMSTPTPAVVLWGPDHHVLYNESYPPLAGEKHPALLGMSAKDGFAEAWDRFEPFIRRCREAGHGATFEDMQFFLNRGLVNQEETYFSISIAPIVDRGSSIVGFIEHITETTKRKISERRMATILEMGEKTSLLQNFRGFWDQISATLSLNTHDVSFAAMYSVNEDVEPKPEKASSCSKRLRLERTIGVPKGYHALPYDVEGGNLKGLTVHFAEAYATMKPLYLSIDDGTLEAKTLDGLYSRVFHDPCRSIAILPLVPTTGHSSDRDTILGFIIIGLNTRRPYDDEYKQFITVLRRQITTSMAAVLLLEEEVRRGRTIAEQSAVDQRSLEEKLQARTSELEARNLQLKHFTDCIPVGIYVLEFGPEIPRGRYVYRNDKWWELIAMLKEEEEGLHPGQSRLWDTIHKDDVEEARANWQALLITKSSASFAFRAPRDRNFRVEVEGNARWLLAYAFAVVDEDSNLRSVVGSLTDITKQKWAEDAQKRRFQDAMEAKRQQENFIDVTSHEMRNPLSAIMISADDILSSLRSLEAGAPNPNGKLEEILRSSIDAAQVIADCAQHQRRIVDDILTISKLDSGLFSFTPSPTAPAVVIKNVLKMFDPEFAAGGISRYFNIDPSFQILGVDQVLLDPSRLLQILINLVANSIKFTKYEHIRNITISMRTSLVEPIRTMHGHDFLPQRKQRDDLTTTPDWGNGGIVYLEFVVEDTGKGLTPSEKELLFKRFSQTPKTHVNYGGSGLGLFISRELVELQGGQIGVFSAGQHEGSDFSFYIKTRRAIPSNSPFQDQQLLFSTSQNEAQSAYAVRSVLDHDIMDVDTSETLIDTPPTTLSSPKSKHALIVEDNLINQQVLQKQLLKLGYTISIANHGQEALDFLLTTTFSTQQKNNPRAPHISVVLMDSEMPVLDGLAAVKRIREMERSGIFNEHIPVLCITANVRLEQVNEALAAGMDDVVAKPFRVPELVKQIEKLALMMNGTKRGRG